MRKVTSVRQMQRLALGWRRLGAKVGFVPTMGYLHAGHVSLMKRARRLVGPRGIVVVSIYVNPTQFAPSEDLANYPRDLARDTRLCREAGVDFIFFPSDAQMYAGRETGNYSTYVVEEQLSQGMEGAARPTHFRGVTTVVAKLFNMVLPDVAVFGAKDWQQAAVVKRMVRDLNIPVKVVVAPTHREPDGLAMSSRNKYLTSDERPQAQVLRQMVDRARKIVLENRCSGRLLSAHSLKTEALRLLAWFPDARVDYIEVFNPVTLQPLKTVASGAHMALAVFVGKTRLIDNARL